MPKTASPPKAMHTAMEDVQSGPALVPLPIDKVGVQNLQIPLVVRDRAQGRQHTVASVDVSVDLPSAFKGTHMSRFVEALKDLDAELNYQSMKVLLEDVKTRLEARRAHIIFKFPYFIRKNAPASQASSLVSYVCKLTGDLEDSTPSFILEVEVPVMTVCPCSKAISTEGAHSQRTLVRIAVRMKGFLWIEEIVDIAEKSGSSAVYSLLKREDEKYVTEYAFAHPAFVEDVVRSAAIQLSEHELISWFKVEVQSLESIHNHDAFACIESQTNKK